MYILIFEDGTIRRINDINDDILSESDNGYVDIISVSDLMIYNFGTWKDIDLMN